MSPRNRSYVTDEGFWIGAASWVPRKANRGPWQNFIFACATSRSTIWYFGHFAAASSEVVRTMRGTDVALSMSRWGRVVFPSVAALARSSPTTRLRIQCREFQRALELRAIGIDDINDLVCPEPKRQLGELVNSVYGSGHSDTGASEHLRIHWLQGPSPHRCGWANSVFVAWQIQELVCFCAFLHGRSCFVFSELHNELASKIDSVCKFRKQIAVRT
jgi:hypothetical protein